MKKLFLSLSILIASCGVMLASNAPASQTPETCQNEKGCKKSDKKCKHNKEGKNGHKIALKCDKKLFDGIELTEQQKEQLKELRKSICPDKKQGKAEGKKNLTAEQKKQLKEEWRLKREESKLKFDEGVKNILTPEQYTKFLENQNNKGKMKLDKNMKVQKGDKVKKAKKINKTA